MSVEGPGHVLSQAMEGMQKSADQYKKEAKKEAQQEQKKEAARKEESMVSRMMSEKRDDAKLELVRKSLDQAPTQARPEAQSKAVQEQIQKEVATMFEQPARGEDAVKLSAQMAQKSSEMQKESKRETSKEKQMQQDAEFKQAKQDAGSAKQTLSSAAAQTHAKDRFKRTGSAPEPNSDTQNPQKAAKEYANAFSKYLFSKSPQEKQKMEQLRQHLQRNGVSSKQISQMEQKLSNVVGQQVMSNVKTSLLKKWFTSGGGIQDMMADREHLNAVSRLGSGADDASKSHARSGLVTARDGMKRQLNDFFFAESEQAFIAKFMGGSEEAFQEKLAQLQKLADKAGLAFNTDQLLGKIGRMLDDLGLEHFIPPTSSDQTFSSMDEGDDSENDEAPVVYLSQEDVLEDQLRMLYMQKALNPNIRERLKIVFQARKLRADRAALGEFDEKMDRQLEQEGMMLAKLKIMEQLQGNLREQSTLEKLEGPSYDILKKSYDLYLKQLKRLGDEIGESELKRLRDEANKEMFPMIKAELMKVEATADVTRNIAASRKRKLLIATLKRLKDETAIKEDIGVDDDDHLPASTIAESA